MSAPGGGMPPGFPGMGMPGGFPGMNMEMLQQFLQDPNIRRMTEAISQDPAFVEMAKEMQESMLSGGMGGLNLEAAAEGEDAGPAEAARAVPALPGMLGMPGMPGIDPSKYMEAMQRVMANPEFLSAAESLGRNLMTQSMDPEMASMMELFSAPANQEALRKQLEGLKDDPELGEVMRDIEENGQQALMKYMNDPELMASMGRKFQEAMAQVERPGGAVAAAALGEGGSAAEGEEEETIITVASAGQVDRLRELLREEGGAAKVDLRDEEGRSALHFASGYGEVEAMEALLETGADADARDNNKNTPLHYAAGYGVVAAAEVLLRHKADLGALNFEGKTAAQVAELNEQAELVAVLAEHAKASGSK